MIRYQRLGRSEIVYTAALMVRALKANPVVVNTFMNLSQRNLSYEQGLCQYFQTELAIYLRKGIVLVAKDDLRIVGVSILVKPHTHIGLVQCLRLRRLTSILDLFKTSLRREIRMFNNRNRYLRMQSNNWELRLLAVELGYQDQKIETDFLKQGIFPTVMDCGGTLLTVKASSRLRALYFQNIGFQINNFKSLKSGQQSVPIWGLSKVL
ncbi:hypothetical protein [Levilactobacillus brevis]|uniref:hypothetical protein n=1 Tax=Levilactobacillus brevis TaxID=1580 RepID=UPI00111878F3|nr:hypothetical protein [Levilactobacillus brevis]QCZ46833.1 hypothetical protein UCCLB556_1958 [Levilactobacillus brevis]